MKIITIAAQKGGSGKTAIARSLSAKYTLAGKQVLLIDLDPQGTTSRWLERRKKDDITMLETVPHPDMIASYLELMKADSTFDVVIIDTPPTVPYWMPDVMRASDLVLIPAKASTDDLDAVGPTIAAARSANAEIAFVVTMSNPRTSIATAVARSLAKHGRVAPENIANRVIYAEIGGEGQSVYDTKDAKAKTEFDELYAYVEEVLS